MKLYMHPVSATSRPVRLFIRENDIDCEEQTIDLMVGEHFAAGYSTVNPNSMVPALEDGDLCLTESSAILKYLADRIGSSAYPKDLKRRAKVNEMMDWFNTQFYRDYGYGLVYPQIFPHQKRPSDEAQAGTIAWGKERAERWLRLLNDHWIGPDKQYLTGNDLTIADYFGSAIVTLGELIRCDLGRYANVQRWLDSMKQLESWPAVNEAFYGFAESLKDRQFTAI